MSSAIRLDYREPPQQWLQYLRALLSKQAAHGSLQMPPLNAFLVNQRANQRQVKHYAKVCEFDQRSPYLPISYPHLLAFPLHMELMLHADFPLKLMGLVHVQNRIQQHRPIRIEEPLDIHCYLSEFTETARGIEFTLYTDISRAGEIIWQEASVMLSRRSKTATTDSNNTSSNRITELTSYEHTQRWSLSSNLGRRYAQISGDSNPIHLFALSAKLFGFKRHIAHGMWSMARVAAALTNNEQRTTIDIAFKQPIFLPNQIELHHQFDDQGTVHFELRSRDQQRVHAKGMLTD